MNKHNAIILFAGLVFLVLPLAVWAQGGCGVCSGGGFCIPNPLKACTFQELVDGIIWFLFQLAMVVAPLMFVIAGFIFVIGGGNPDSIRRAKNIFLFTVIGLAIIMVANGIIKVLEDILGKR